MTKRRLRLSKPVLIYAVGALVLTAILLALVTKTRNVDFETHNTIIGHLRELKQVDAEWNADVLRSKMGLNLNYDPVVSPLPIIRELEAALTTRTTLLGASVGRDLSQINGLLANHKSLMDSKTNAIEQFKSQNSILRNSLHYLPVAASEIADAARSDDVAPTRRTELATRASNLLSEVMTYVQIPDEERKSRLEEAIRSFGSASLQYPENTRERIEQYLSHLATVLAQDQIGRRMLAVLTRFPTAKTLDLLSDAYTAEHEAMLREQEFYRTILIGYSAFLLMLLGYYGWRLVSSYRLLNRTNVELVQANHQLKESQVQLVQSEKMSALGQMVAGIAHEINTPLAYVRGTLDVVNDRIARLGELARESHTLARMARDKRVDRQQVTVHFNQLEKMAGDLIDKHMVEESEELLKEGLRGIDQMSEIVVNLKNFSRIDRARSVPYDLSEGLESTLLLAKNILKNRIKVVKEFGELPKVVCAPSQINQVFLNVITNAAQAIVDSGEITIRTQRHDADTVRVEIQDNGSGIPADVLSKIFDPFFTTKDIGKGTGMGLSISYKIIEEHGGRILVDSEPGIGTVFTILLPINQVRAAEASIAEDLPQVALAT